MADDDRAGHLLRQADEAFREGLAEGPAWQRFQARSRRNYQVFWVVAAAAAALLVWHARHPSEPQQGPLTVTAERATVHPPSVNSAPERDVPEPPDVERRNPSLDSPEPPALVSRGGRGNRAPVAVADEASSTAARGEVDCRALSTEGKLEQAVACFQMLSRGSGLNAEVALYEAARLSSEGLHDARHALTLLEQHRERFPNSALRGEIEWLRVRSLQRAHRFEEALTASEQLLATPAGRALSSKLHLLRGHIYRDEERDCAHAVREFVALLGEPGADGDDAELGRAQCLEQLGTPSEARAAYERYLERPDARARELAKQRLHELEVGLSGSKF